MLIYKPHVTMVVHLYARFVRKAPSRALSTVRLYAGARTALVDKPLFEPTLTRLVPNQEALRVITFLLNSFTFLIIMLF